MARKNNEAGVKPPASSRKNSKVQVNDELDLEKFKVVDITDETDTSEDKDEQVDKLEVFEVSDVVMLKEAISNIMEHYLRGKEDSTLKYISLKDYSGELNLNDITVDIDNVTYTIADMENEFFAGIEDWDVSGVDNLETCFSDFKHFNRDLNKWNVENVMNFHAMFSDCSSYDKPLLNWNIKETAQISNMFSGTNFKEKVSYREIINVKPDMVKRSTFIGTPIIVRSKRRVAR